MDRKTKKIVLISFIVGIVMIIVSLFYMVNSSKDLELRSGTYFCKMYILNQGTTRNFKWDLSISKNDSKNSVIENASNSKSLKKFRNTISEIIKKRYEMFALILYLIFVLIIFLVNKPMSLPPNLYV